MCQDNGFDKSKRLLNAAAFKAVFDQVDAKVSRRHLLMLTRKNGLQHPRLGLVIAKKNVRLSVQRNRVKRIIRESFRLRQNSLPAVDIIVLARKGLDQLDNAELHKELEKMWQRLAEKYPDC